MAEGVRRVQQGVDADSVPDHQLVKTRWVDTNCGYFDNVAVRSRMVAQMFRRRDPPLPRNFAATPPGEAMKLALAIAVSTPGLVVMVLDGSRAHFHSAVARKLTIQLPAEDYEAGNVGLLHMCLYTAPETRPVIGSGITWTRSTGRTTR